MWANVAASLIPTLIDIIKDAIIAAKGNDEVAKGILLGILGANEENETRIAITLARAKIALALDETEPVVQ